MEDKTSIGLCLSTFILGAIHAVSANDLLIWVTIIAGVTTIAYNAIKIYKDLHK